MFAELYNNNASLSAAISVIERVAGYLWQKGWAECSAGNISVNLSTLLGKECPVIEGSVAFDAGGVFPLLAGDLLYVTGTGTRMRDVSCGAFQQGCLIRVDAEGSHCEMLAPQGMEPTSELRSHLAIQQFLKSRGNSYATVLHSHPTELIALTHHRQFLEGNALNRMLWAMIPEVRMFVPHGAGLVPYELPGSRELARASISALVDHDAVLWEKHGALSVGRTAEECFDTLDILNKSAQIYLAARMTGMIPEGLTDEQVGELNP